MEGRTVHVISTGKQSTDQLASVITEIDPFITAVHIRERNWKTADFTSLFQQLQAAGIQQEKVIVNGMLCEEVLSQVGGIHLPEREMLHIPTLKEEYPALSIGCSVHSVESARKAETLGVDHIMYGHIFKTDSKRGLEPRGVEQLAEICRAVLLPVIAIGGITYENAARVIEAGAAGIAVLSGILLAADPVIAASAYKAALE